MAFLNLLKKRPKKLDIPPPPPALDIPPPPEDLELPDLELPELPPLPGEEEFMPEIEEPEPTKKIPEFPKIKPIKEEIPIKPILPIPELKKPKVKAIKPVEKEEAEIPKKEIFLKVDHYKNVLESLNVVKKKINESEKIVERLNEIKNTKDKEFEKWRTLLEDMERKFVYVDKTFFEG